MIRRTPPRSSALARNVRKFSLANACEAVVACELEACVDCGLPDEEHARLLRERSLAGQRLVQVRWRDANLTARRDPRRRQERSKRPCGP